MKHDGSMPVTQGDLPGRALRIKARIKTASRGSGSVQFRADGVTLGLSRSSSKVASSNTPGAGDPDKIKIV